MHLCVAYSLVNFSSYVSLSIPLKWCTNIHQQQKDGITKLKTALPKTTKQFEETESELAAANTRICEQHEEIAELCDLHDSLEQCTRKNSLEIHGVPESTYTSTEKVVLKLVTTLEVFVDPEDIKN